MSTVKLNTCYFALLTVFICRFETATTTRLRSNDVLSRNKRGATDMISNQMKKDLLDKHNELRRQEQKSEGVSNMQYMYWDDGLAAQAKTWAEKCDFEHGGNTNYNGGTAETTWSVVGQNLGWHSSKTDPLYTVDQWYNEKSDYGYDGHTCSAVCGHYTQVVWGSSKYLGCSFVQCQPLTESSTGKSWGNGYYLVCHYGPPGNLQSTRPYTKGSGCSRCDSGTYSCDNGLCRDCLKDGVQGCNCEAQCENCGSVNQTTCSCSCYKGYRGARCTEECKDNHANCGSGWYPSNCGFDFVSSNCPAMCKTCDAPDGTCIPTTSGPTTEPPTGATSTAQVATQPNTVPATSDGNSGDSKTTDPTNNGYCSTAITCLNGGNPDSPSSQCSCRCTKDWQGDTCQFSKDEVSAGVVLTFKDTSKSMWDKIWINIKSIIGDSVNAECNSGGDCNCGSTGHTDHLAKGQGYPHQETPTDYVKVLVFVDKNSCPSGSPTPVSQDTLHSAIKKSEANITKTVDLCCNATLGSIEKGTVADSAAVRWHAISTLGSVTLLIHFLLLRV